MTRCEINIIITISEIYLIAIISNAVRVTLYSWPMDVFLFMRIPNETISAGTEGKATWCASQACHCQRRGVGEGGGDAVQVHSCH